MTEFNWIGFVRDLLRLLVPGVVVVGYVYAVLTGNPAAEQLREFAAPIIAGYLAVDGVLRIANARQIGGSSGSG